MCFCFFSPHNALAVVIRVIRHHRHHYLMSFFLIYGCAYWKSKSRSTIRNRSQANKSTSSLTHTQPKSIHWFNLPLRLWLATFARFTRKPIASRSALSFNWPLRGKKRCRKYFAQFYSDNNYAVYEWTYIDTHVNLCINFLEGFCCACFGAFDHSPTMTWPRWFHALFFIGLLNYSVWRFFSNNFWLHSGFLLRFSIFFTFWHVRFH